MQEKIIKKVEVLDCCKGEGHNCLQCDHMKEYYRWFNDVPMILCDYEGNPKNEKEE